MEFEWYAPKRLTNIEKHGVDFRLAAMIFEGPTADRIDDRKDYGEVRMISVGEAFGEILVVVSTDRSGIRRIISPGRQVDMKEKNIERYSLAELREMHERGDFVPTRDDASPGEELPEGFWEEAQVVFPHERPTSVRLNLEPEVFAFFKAQGKGHITRMQNVLKAYVKAHNK